MVAAAVAWARSVAAQAPPEGAKRVWIELGLGTSAQHGDDAPYGDNAIGSAVSGGFALRLPSHSTFGLTLDVDWIRTVSGTLRTASGLPGSSYRPMLMTIGLGINLAGDPIGTPSR